MVHPWQAESAGSSKSHLLVGNRNGGLEGTPSFFGVTANMPKGHRWIICGKQSQQEMAYNIFSWTWGLWEGEFLVMARKHCLPLRLLCVPPVPEVTLVEKQGSRGMDWTKIRMGSLFSPRQFCCVGSPPPWQVPH